MKIIKSIFAREEASREMMAPETISHQVNAFASPATSLPCAQETTTDGAFTEEVIRMIADIGTGLWRMRQKMVKPGTDEPIDDMRRIYRHFESIWDTIVQAGADIQDHSNNLYGSGMALRVVAFEPTAGVSREVVKETLKPTIYFKGRLIQMGEVIIATPEA